MFLKSACTRSTLLEKFADAEKLQVARTYIQRIVEGDIAGLASELEPALRSGNETIALQQLRAILPPGGPRTTNLVGYQASHSLGKEARYNVTYQFGYESKWELVNAAWRELPDGTRQILGLRAEPLPQSLQEANAFSFQRAGVWHYFLLLGAVLVPAFILFTLVVCVRTKLPRRKWLWIIFILLGIGRFSINWTSGELNYAPLSVMLLGVSALAPSMYAPWTISVALPVGAALFWRRRKQLQGAESAATPSPSGIVSENPSDPTDSNR